MKKKKKKFSTADAGPVIWNSLTQIKVSITLEVILPRGTLLGIFHSSETTGSSSLNQL